MSFRTRKLCVVRCFRLFLLLLLWLLPGGSFVLVTLIIHIRHICCLPRALKKGSCIRLFCHLSVRCWTTTGPQLSPRKRTTALGWVRLVDCAKYVSIGMLFDLTAGLAFGSAYWRAICLGPASQRLCTNYGLPLLRHPSVAAASNPAWGAHWFLTHNLCQLRSKYFYALFKGIVAT